MSYGAWKSLIEYLERNRNCYHPKKFLRFRTVQYRTWGISVDDSPDASFLNTKI